MSNFVLIIVIVAGVLLGVAVLVFLRYQLSKSFARIEARHLEHLRLLRAEVAAQAERDRREKQHLLAAIKGLTVTCLRFDHRVKTLESRNPPGT